VKAAVLTDIANLHVNFRCTKQYILGDGLNSCGISTGESTMYQWRTQEFFSEGGSTNSVEDRENRDLGVVAP